MPWKKKYSKYLAEKKPKCSSFKNLSFFSQKNMSFDFKKVQEILKTELQDEYLFRTAFTHRSYLNEHTEKAHKSNERLEFLGDAVLQLLSSEYLFEHYKNSPEGDMTNYRSAVVCTTSIGDEARRLGYGEMLLLSNGKSTGGREREYIGKHF